MKKIVKKCEKFLIFLQNLKNRQIQTNFDKYNLPLEMKYEKNVKKCEKC